MSRGQPDYGQYAVKEVSAAVSDMGEVAARLGSIVTYDKRGDVVDFDNFEEPILKWEVIVVGTGSYGRLDTDDALSGSQSVKLHTPDIAASQVSVDKGSAILGTKKLGFEISFSHLSTNCYFDLWAVYFDGSNWIQAAVVFDPSAGTLKIMDHTGGMVTATVIADTYSHSFMFHTIKLVADFTTRYYARLLFDTHEYDISGTRLYVKDSVQSPYLDIGVKFRNRATNGGDVWVDNFVITQAEP